MLQLRVTNGVMDHPMVRLVEWSMAVVLTLFGVTLLEPGDTFVGPSYAILAKIAGEDTWGWIFTVLGGSRLLALILDRARFQSHSLRLRAILSTVSCVAWCAIIAGKYMANPQSTSARTYVPFLIVDIITAFYLGRQAGLRAKMRG
jgi:hypothetical protein